jgi:aspartyl-tRNA synthetase
MRGIWVARLPDGPAPCIATAQPGQHSLLWVVDFPMFEYNPDEGRYQVRVRAEAARRDPAQRQAGGCGSPPRRCAHGASSRPPPRQAIHHPFTAPRPEDWASGDLVNARALAYDLVYNGVEVRGTASPKCSLAASG